MGWIVKLDEKGRIVIPRDVRDKLGLKEGDTLTLDVQEDIITLSRLETGRLVQVNEAEHELKHFLSES